MDLNRQSCSFPLTQAHRIGPAAAPAPLVHTDWCSHRCPPAESTWVPCEPSRSGSQDQRQPSAKQKLGARTRLAGAALRCERASRWRRSTTPAAACSRSSRRPQRTSPAVRRRAPPRRSSRRRSSSPRRSSTGAEPSAGPSLRIRNPQLLRLLLRFSRILPPAAPPSTHMYSVLR